MTQVKAIRVRVGDYNNIKGFSIEHKRGTEQSEENEAQKGRKKISDQYSN